MGKKVGFYLYCLCKFNPDINYSFEGIKGKKTFTLKDEDYTAVISKIDELIVDPLEKNVLKHEDVNTKIFEQTTIIPMSFGNIFKSKKDIIYLIKKLTPQIKQIIPRIKNKVELGVKIFWSPEKIIEEIAAENPGLKKQKQDDYYNQINIGKEISMFLEHKRQSLLEPILNKLNSLAEAANENKLIGDKMILNEAFLVDKENEKKFDKAVTEIYEKYNNRLEIKYSGPWPPYNFTNIKVQVK